MSVRRFDIEAGGDSFAFAAETEPKVAFWLGKYPEERKRSAVIPMLWLAQKDNKGWLSEPAMREVADRLDMPYVRVYEVATFYTMFRLSPVGEHHIQLCGTTPCMLRGANDLKDVCSRVIGKKGQPTDNGRLSWEEVECLGACVNAPMVQINDYYYEDLTPQSFEEILQKLDAGVAVEPGTFVDRFRSAPAGEAKTLIDAALFDGSAVSAISSLPNVPEAKAEEPVAVEERPAPAPVPEKPAAKPAPEDMKTVEAEEEPVDKDDVAYQATQLSEDDHKKPEVLSAPEGGKADELQRVKGIGPVLSERLNTLGIYHFHQIASWSAAEIAWVDGFMGFRGRILREKWIPQAKELAKEGGDNA